MVSADYYEREVIDLSLHSSTTESPLWPVCDEIVTRFDSDIELRYDLLTRSCSISFQPLTREELDEMFSDTHFNEIVSGVYDREKAISSLLFFLLIRDALVADRKITVTKDDLAAELTRELLRDEWLTNHEARIKFEALISHLNKAIRWFNVQFICTELHKTCTQQKELPLCGERGLSRSVVSRESTIIANEAYYNATGIFHQTVKPYEAFIEAAGEDLADMFQVDSLLINQLMLSRMGKIIDIPTEVGDLAPSKPDSENDWAETPSGLLVPRKK